MRTKATLLSAAAISLALPATAQTTESDQKRLDVITVESSRLDQTLTEIGTSVDIITADELEELGFDFAVDAIANVAGATVNQNSAFGGQATVRLRGMSSGQTLVMIDGIPVNDVSNPGSSFDFAHLATSNVERIEVLKGPQSTLWGSDAIGGVISITTRTPDEGFGGQAYGEIGSFSTVQAGATLEYGNEKGEFRISANGIDSDGISKADKANGNNERDGYENINYAVKGGFNFSPTTRLSGGVNYSDAETDIDGYVFGAQGSVGDTDQANTSEEISAHAKLDFILFSDQLKNSIFVGHSKIDRENLFAGATSSESEGERLFARYQGNYEINSANALAFGLEHEGSEFDSASAFGADAGEHTLDSAFALYELKPAEALTLTAGVRVDDHDTYGTHTTGRFAAAYTPNALVTLRASWAQGFKAPSLYQLFSAYGDENLSPEEAEGFDIGLDFRTPDNKGHFGITLFDQEVENQIDFSNDTFTYANIAMVETRGVELTAGYQLLDWLSVSADYAYIDAEDGDGVELIRIPEHSGDIKISFTPEGPFSSALLLRYNGEEDASGSQTVDEWTRVDWTASLDVNETVELYTRVENLFDEEYQQILGYGTPGISASFGLRVNY